MGCNSKADLSEFVEVNFSGYDSMGSASFFVDEERLIQHVFEVSGEEFFNLDYDTIIEIEDMLSSYQVTLDRELDLSNGDEVIASITVDENKSSKIKGKDEVKFTVAGLEEPSELSDEELEKNIVVNFTGVSGKGNVIIDTTFAEPLSHLRFEAVQDGDIHNDDTVTVMLTDESRSSLSSYGYVLSGEGKAEFTAANLDVVATDVSQIVNVEDIERLISEGINREYQDSPWDFYKYEIKKEHTLYRQYKRDDEEVNFWTSGPSNGTLVNVYTIKKIDSDGALTEQFTTIYGFTDIILDEENKANIAQINEYYNMYDQTYSLESVVKLMEGHGYQLVE